jgi:hypothetical protein
LNLCQLPNLVHKLLDSKKFLKTFFGEEFFGSSIVLKRAAFYRATCSVIMKFKQHDKKGLKNP